MSEHRLRDEAGTLRVRLNPTDGATTVLVDDHDHVVTRIVRGPRAHHRGAASAVVRFVLDGRPVQALVTRTADGITVTTEGQTFAFAHGDDADAGTTGRLGTGTVTAPMPGKIIAVLVAVGDTVAVGQGLLVLEAMKMESTLAAEISGTVTQVTVAAGDLVDGGTLLVEVAPT